ncbi:MAG: heat-inducible transcriptional repressor HrcA [Clostridia bacterium]|nr:heat-inducible transcriptional repressor HrcA [Clostridia bacterium]
MDKHKLSPRKQKILKAVVEEYIMTANPISSGVLQDKYLNDISSATIRNELSALEEMGYLIQPHISSGRIPSKNAYKIYAEEFVEKKSLTKKEIALIENTFLGSLDSVEDIVKKTAKVITDITNYTSVIVVKNVSDVLIKSIRLVDINEKSALVIIITDSGIIKDKIINFDYEIDANYISNASGILNDLFAGKKVNELKDAENNLNDELVEYRYLFKCVLNVILSFMASQESNVVLSGKNKLLNSPEQDINTAKDFLDAIDEDKNISDIISNADDKNMEFNVKIGKDENGGIDKCAIVTANYSFNKGKDIGYAGVIGPERMNYGKVMSVLDFIKKIVEDKGNK